jgi:hypothetical protein
MIFLPNTKSKIDFITNKRRTSKRIRTVFIEKKEFRFLGGSNINNRRIAYLADKIINEIMNNPDKFNARANKESITNRYKDSQDKIKRQNKHRM